MSRTTCLYTADIHVTMRASEDYRWRIFPWLNSQCRQRGVSDLVIIGDLTDAKDHHPAALIHKLLRNLTPIAEHTTIHVIKGNHDYVDEHEPFFEFLGGLKGRVAYYSKPVKVHIGGRCSMILPHTRQPKADWVGLNFAGVDRVFLHQTVKGASVAGRDLEGSVPLSLFNNSLRDTTEIIGGDVHWPQEIGKRFRYCGAPHPIVFGDTYDPRVLLDKPNGLVSLARPTQKKRSITITDPRQLRSGISAHDMVKVTVKLPRSEFGRWAQIRRDVIRIMDEGPVYLHGLELVEDVPEGAALVRASDHTSPVSVRKPQGILAAFGEANNIDPRLLKRGQRLLREVDINEQT